MDGAAPGLGGGWGFLEELVRRKVWVKVEGPVKGNKLHTDHILVSEEQKQGITQHACGFPHDL